MGRYKVVEFVHGLSDGGAETLVKEYVRLIDKTAFDPMVLVQQFNHHSTNEKEVRGLGVKVLPICSDSYVQKLLFHFFRKEYTINSLKSILRDTQPDVLHVHGQLLHYLAEISEELKQIKLFYTCHSVPERYFTGEHKAEFDAAKKLIKNNNLQMIALHDQMKEELNTMFGIQNTVVLRNGVDFNKFKDLEVNVAEYRQSIGIPSDAFVIGHVGRFIYIKNQTFLVDVFEEVLKRNNKAYLLMIGHGDDLSKIKDIIDSKKISDHVIILSHRSDIAQLLRCMDVFVFPSLFEGIPLTLIEAQVSGLKCVCSDTINCEALVSNKTLSLPLDAGKERWADSIMSSEPSGICYVEPDEYDLYGVVRKLETLYQA